jgi:hypothetical protein
MGYENHIFCAADLGKEKVVETIFSLLEQVHDFRKVVWLKIYFFRSSLFKNFPAAAFSRVGSLE